MVSSKIAKNRHFWAHFEECKICHFFANFKKSNVGNALKLWGNEDSDFMLYYWNFEASTTHIGDARQNFVDFRKNPKMENKRLYVTVYISKTIILREFLMAAIDKTRRFKSDNTEK